MHRRHRNHARKKKVLDKGEPAETYHASRWFACECGSIHRVTHPTSDQVKNPADPNSDVYLGVKPEVTDPPRVIHGEVKF